MRPRREALLTYAWNCCRQLFSTCVVCAELHRSALHSTLQSSKQRLEELFRVHTQSSSVYSSLCVHTYRSQGLVSNVFLSLSPPISFEAASLTEPGTHCSSYTGKPDAPGILLGPLRSQACNGTPTWLCTSVLVLGNKCVHMVTIPWQTLYQRSSLPASSSIF